MKKFLDCAKVFLLLSVVWLFFAAIAFVVAAIDYNSNPFLWGHSEWSWWFVLSRHCLGLCYACDAWGVMCVTPTLITLALYLNGVANDFRSF